ncbi:HNH nuclease [Lactiplantibacillus plantarum]|nr:HNH nuclease [Lactiplantibacillus plantarum]MCG0941447.1 HNH nuclease [Lactiplantibacillus plantarum]BEI53624.1 prophage protein [Lactiplantibacillus plantarum]BEI54975.1 prophage protein [Lactiplantibacillus plantarum]
MVVMIHRKYGYEPPEWVQADSRLDKWCKDRKRRANKHGAFSLDKKRSKQTKTH